MIMMIYIITIVSHFFINSSISFYMILIMTLMIQNSKNNFLLLMNMSLISITLFIITFFSLTHWINSWILMSLFLIMIGGLMVIFLYFNSFLPSSMNILMKFTKINYLLTMFMITTTLTFFLKVNFPSILKLKINEMVSYQMPMFVNFNYMSFSFMLVSFTFYLFFILIILNFLCYTKNSSLRKLN